MEYTLSMVFTTEYGEKTSLSINGVKPGITQDDVDKLMDTLIEKNVFVVSSGALVGKGSARLIAKTITKYDVA